MENLLPPLLNLLDGRHDFPAPKDKEKGEINAIFLSTGTTHQFDKNFLVWMVCDFTSFLTVFPSYQDDVVNDSERL